MIVELVREQVQEACRKPENLFSPQFYEQHLCVVAQYANKLAGVLGADPEIVELAALLHDISAVRDIKTLAQHAQCSAQEAEEMLKRAGCPHDRVQRVKQSILTHTAPVAKGNGTVEEMCVSNADAISQIVRPAYWLYFVFTMRKLAYKEGFDWLNARLDTNWNALIPEARELIKDEYATVKKALGYSI